MSKSAVHRRRTALFFTLALLWTGALPAVAVPPAAAASLSAAVVAPAVVAPAVVAPAVVAPAVSRARAAAAAISPQQAVTEGAAAAAAQGVTQYVTVVDRQSGQVLGRTANADQQVASESVMKVLLAAYHLVIRGGPAGTPPDLLGRLSFMVQASDNGTTSALFSAAAVPAMAARYGLPRTQNASPTVGRWGAVRITADDMALFLYRASQDAAVGPWLLPTMAGITDFGAGDGFDQRFGLNGISGEHGAKQGWGGDTTWLAERWSIHSIGYTDRYFVSILSTSTRYADPARATLTHTARLIQQSRTALQDGDFLRADGRSEVYRLVGGAPVFVPSWDAFGGSQPVRVISAAELDALPTHPADGTFISAGGAVYRMAGGAPIHVPSWDAFGGPQPTVEVHPSAVTFAGLWSPWHHLRRQPAEGTFLTAGGYNYQIVGGAPIFVPSWDIFGGPRATVGVHPWAITHAGKWAPWNNLRDVPADGTFITAGQHTYRIAGGAPIYVLSWDAFGGPRPTSTVHPWVVANAGQWAPWDKLRQQPADGTFISDGTYNYRIVGGAPVFVPSWDVHGGPQPTVGVHPSAVTHAGKWAPWNNLRALPADGTFITAGSYTYRIAGGAPLYVPSWDVYGGPQPTVTVDPSTVTYAGLWAPWDKLRQQPLDGTFLSAAGAAYAVSGGTPVRIWSWDYFGGPQPTVGVHPLVIQYGGLWEPWHHLNAAQE